MDESKIEELRSIHRDLARYLGEQHETIEGMAVVIGALRKTIEDDSVLSKKYKVHFQSLTSNESGQPNRVQAGILHEFLTRLRNW